MISESQLRGAVQFFLSKGDLSHQSYDKEIMTGDDENVFEPVQRMFSISFFEAVFAWEAALSFQSLREGELIDGCDEVPINLWELYLDAESEEL